MLAVTRRLLRHDAEAHEALREAFSRAFEAIDAFDEQASLEAWLHGFARSAALRRVRPMEEPPLDVLLPAFLEDGHHARHPHAWTIPDDVGGRVRAAVDRLPDAYRIVLLLHDAEGLDAAAVARALGLTDNLVELRLHRARQALRGLLEAHFEREN